MVWNTHWFWSPHNVLEIIFLYLVSLNFGATFSKLKSKKNQNNMPCNTLLLTKSTILAPSIKISCRQSTRFRFIISIFSSWLYLNWALISWVINIQNVKIPILLKVCHIFKKRLSILLVCTEGEIKDILFRLT